MVSRTDYFYALHRNADGHEWAARQFSDVRSALLELSVEGGERLRLAERGARATLCTLTRFSNKAARKRYLLGTMLVVTMT